MKTLGVLLLACAGLVHADVFQFTGTLNPAANLNLVFWDQYAPGYATAITGPDDWDRAFNIAVHSFSLSVAGPVTVSSKGYNEGGFDSVVAIFAGTGDPATYLKEGFSPAHPGDFSFGLDLAAGDYTLTVSMWNNEPCAAGPCYFHGEFGDGFANLVNFDESRDKPLFYDVEVATQVSAVPEPSSLILLTLAVAISFARRRG